MTVSEELRKVLKRQGYKLVGKNAAAKACTWTCKAMRGEGQCYKNQFYGIASHRCVQITPCVGSCTFNCLFCWRAGEFTPMLTDEDEPNEIIDGVLEAQWKMLSGFGGRAEADKKLLKEAKEPKHVAISLAGEPTLYSKLPELVNELNARGFTTFVVSNGSNPEMLAKIRPTQLYISLYGPEEQTFSKTAAPLISGAWEKVLESLKQMKKLGKQGVRTTIRLTLVKDWNMKDPEGFAELIKKADPMFIECKAYMHVGYSVHRLPRSAMPSHEEILEFSKEIAKHTGYLLKQDNPKSRVTLLARDEKAYEERIIADARKT